ncbi:MAG: VacJ family lipoprotein [Arenicellales bacterium]|nr:VacJ family lipoprotein [Arenicellales bacterium]
MSRKASVKRVLLYTLLFPILLSACATTGSIQEYRDPFEKYNRAIYRFNDGFDRAILKPVAQGYRKVVPSPVRKSVGNFFRNLLEPTTIINDILQGKIEQAVLDTTRFLFNTTFGLLGFFDFSTLAGLERHQEDFGQTFAVWGFKPGPFIMLPFIGPTNLRDGIGLLPYYLYTDPRLYNPETSVNLALIGINAVDSRAQLLTGSKLLDLQLDPYAFLRETYNQRRLNLIYDGDPPLEVEE